MTINHQSDNWRGNHATPIDPDAIRFGVAPGGPVPCEGCCFIGQRISVCRRAAEIATAAGGIDCDDKMPNGRAVIYVLTSADPRQLDLLEQAGRNATAIASAPVMKKPTRENP